MAFVLLFICSARNRIFCHKFAQISVVSPNSSLVSTQLLRDLSIFQGFWMFSPSLCFFNLFHNFFFSFLLFFKLLRCSDDILSLCFLCGFGLNWLLCFDSLWFSVVFWVLSLNDWSHGQEKQSSCQSGRWRTEKNGSFMYFLA